MINLKQLQETVQELDLDLQAIAEEHDKYCLKTSTDDEAMNWLHSLPIETLKDSLDKEHQRPRSKYSMHDIVHKSALRKLHEKKKNELESHKNKLNIARLDSLIAKIEEILG
jgi:hypothetical protein